MYDVLLYLRRIKTYNMMKLFTRMLLCLACCLLASSCQKAIYDDTDPEEAGNGVTLRFNVAQFEQIPFDKAFSPSRGTNVANACSRINFAVYQNGKRIKQINQMKDSTEFGTIKLKLDKGKYFVALVAHSVDKDATMSDPTKITFTGTNGSKQVSDTFWFADSINVKVDSVCDLRLKRAVALLRLVTTDSIPENVVSVFFRYNGGSSTFDAVKGVGVVNSRQTEERIVSAEMIGKPAMFDIYTFPHAETDTLRKLQVAAYDKYKKTLVEKTFEKVPMRRNNITVYTGRFFSKGDDDSGTGGGTIGESKDMDFTINLMSDDEWTETHYNY